MNQPLGGWACFSLSLYFPVSFMIMGGDQFLPFTWKRRPIQFTWVIVVKNLNLAERNSIVDPNTVFPFCKVVKGVVFTRWHKRQIKPSPQGLSSKAGPPNPWGGGRVMFLNNG